MRISNRVIYRLFRNIERNRKRKDRGIPVSAVLFYKRGEIKFSANNKRTENKMPNSNTHAELLCLNNFKGRGKHEDNKYRLIVLLEPCEDCIEVINTDGRISEVIYLTNEKYGKSKLGLLNVPHTLYEPNKETKPIVDKLLANFKKFQKTKFYTRKEGE